MGKDKFEEELQGLKKDLKKFSTPDSNFEDKLNELKSGIEKLDNMDISTSENITSGEGTAREQKTQDNTSQDKKQLQDTSQEETTQQETTSHETAQKNQQQSPGLSLEGTTEQDSAPNEKQQKDIEQTPPQDLAQNKQTPETSQEEATQPDSKESGKSEQQASDKSRDKSTEKPIGLTDSGDNRSQDELSQELSGLKQQIGEKEDSKEQKTTDEKIQNLQDSISHLDKAIKNLITIFNRATNELEDDSDSELSQKMDKIIEQNEKILSKIDSQDTGENKEESQEQPQGGSPFMPEPNLPSQMKPVKQNEAPKPPEEGDHIPKLKPRKSKYDA